MANPGRKSKLTAEVQEKIVSAIKAGNYAVVAAEFAGISQRTFYNWLQWGEERRKGPYLQFLRAVKAAESEAEVRAVATIQTHMTTNWQAAMTFLERKFPERWARRIRVMVDPRKELSDLGLDPEEIDAVIEEAAKS